MGNRVNKTPKHQESSRTTSPRPPVQKSKATFIDNRPEAVAQRKRQEMANNYIVQKGNPIQRKANQTGLPDQLKTGIENLSGHSMDDVKVHYNSNKPAQLQAHAYAQGTDIHLASGQEKHLPHEAWHVVQQKQGRVKPTMQLKAQVNINDDSGLEREADLMGAKAMMNSVVQQKEKRESSAHLSGQLLFQRVARSQVVQRAFDDPNLEAEAQALEAEAARPDRALRSRAGRLMGHARDANAENEYNRVQGLIDKFSKPKKDKGPKAPKPWEYTKEHEQTAKMLFTAQSKVFAAAQKVHNQETREGLGTLPVEGTSGQAAITIREYRPDDLAAGLGIWSQLLIALRSATQSDSRLHVIHFRTIEGKVITVHLSQHTSAHSSNRPDYFVHDSEADLVMHPDSGIQQGRSPEREHELNQKGDTLNVSYEAFNTKINSIKNQLQVHDPQVAQWLLLIIMSPSIAPAAIRKQAPGLTDRQLNIMYELVSTWMLAEPARHASTMINGVMELELIEAGRKTFAKSLEDSSAGSHPMSHVGSEGHGRDAEHAEIELGHGREKPGEVNANAVVKKQSEQMVASYPSHTAERELESLVHFYTTEVQRVIGREKQ